MVNSLQWQDASDRLTWLQEMTMTMDNVGRRETVVRKKRRTRPWNRVRWDLNRTQEMIFDPEMSLTASAMLPQVRKLATIVSDSGGEEEPDDLTPRKLV